MVVVKVHCRSAVSGEEMPTITMDQEETVATLKHRLWCEDGGSPGCKADSGGLSFATNRVRLLHDRKLLDDWVSLEEAGITEESTLEIIYSATLLVAVTCSSDGTARMWDPETAKCTRVLTGHTGPINSVNFSPDGSLLVTGSQDRTAKLWSVADGKCIVTFEGHKGAVLGASFSPSGVCIGTTGSDRTLRIWRYPSGVCEVIKQMKDIIKSRPSPDGAFFACCCKKNIAELRNKVSGEVERTFEGHKAIVNYATCSYDSQDIATASGDKTAKTWSAHTGQCLQTFVGHDGSVNWAEFSPDGQALATGSNDCTAKIWEKSTGKCRFTLVGHGHHVYSAVFSPDSAKVLTASRDRTAKIWCAKTGECVGTLEGHDGMVNEAFFSP